MNRKFWLKRVLRDQAGSDGGDGGSGAGGGDGKKQPTDSEAALLKEVMAKKEALKKAEEEKAAVAKELEATREAAKAFEGVDLKKYQELLKAQAEAEEAKLKQAGEWDQMKARLLEEKAREREQIVQAHKSELQKATEALAEREKALKQAQSHIEELTVGQSFANSKFVQEKMVPAAQKVRKLFGEHFDVENGQIFAYDKPRGSEARTKLIDGEGKPLSFDAALEKIVGTDPDRETLIRAAVKPGAGSGTENKKGANADGAVEKSGLERIAVGLSTMKFKDKKAS